MKENKLIKGKWYECSGGMIVKYDHLKSECEVWWTEVIHKPSLAIPKRNWSNICNIDREVSIEEIQQFLPEGHIDKIKTMKYTKQDWINGKCAIRWENNKAKEINKFFEDCVPSGNHAQGSHNYYFSTIERNEDWDCSNTTDLPIVTIDELLNNKDMKKIIGYKVPFNMYNDTIKKGEIVIRDTNYSYKVDRSKEGSSNGDSFPNEIVEQWEPVYEDEFKVGDYVTTTTEISSSWEKYKKGEVFKITQINTGSDNLLFAPSCGVDRKRCRLATPEEIKSVQTKTITIGDKRILFTISKGKIEADGTTFSVSDWASILSLMVEQPMLKKYKVFAKEITVGCTTITKDEVELIINTYKQINS